MEQKIEKRKNEKEQEMIEPEIVEVLNKAKEHIPELKNISTTSSEKLGLLIKTYHESIEQTKEYNYEGVLPHPSILKDYEVLYPGTTKAIIDNFMEESKHRREIEKSITDREDDNTKRGMNYALCSLVLILITVGVCAYFDKTLIASVIGVGGLVTLVYNFIQGRRN